MLDPQGYWRRWLSADPNLVLSSMEATNYEGRGAWRFVAPEVKGGLPILTVDAGLGLVLSLERADIGVLRTWTELRTDVELSDALFRYDGPWERAAGHGYPDGWLPE